MKRVFPQIAYFQNSIEKKKVREKGFVIARIPSRKKKKFVRKAS
jgi:hypothetical protein